MKKAEPMLSRRKNKRRSTTPPLETPCNTTVSFVAVTQIRRLHCQCQGRPRSGAKTARCHCVTDQGLVKMGGEKCHALKSTCVLMETSFVAIRCTQKEQRCRRHINQICGLAAQKEAAETASSLSLILTRCLHGDVFNSASTRVLVQCPCYLPSHITFDRNISSQLSIPEPIRQLTLRSRCSSLDLACQLGCSQQQL